jgi:predicted permease
LMNVNPGFRTPGLLTMRIELPVTKYSKPDSVKAFDRRVLDTLVGIPGVSSVAMASGLPMQNINVTGFTIEGAPQAPKGTGPTTDYQEVTGNYFDVMGSRILRGRSFTPAEAEEPEPHVIVINESLSRQYWPGQDPIGKAVLLPSSKKKRAWNIIGIVEDSHQIKLDEPTRPELYRPSSEFQRLSLIVRCTADPDSVAPAVTKQIAAIDANQPVTDVITYNKIVRESTAERRFQMGMLTVFAALALVLASIGLYGVLAYSVVQRTREIGVRVALGAQSQDVIRLVVGQGLLLALIGVVIGLAGSYPLTQLMSSVIFGISPTDPLTFGAVAAGLTLTALLASYLPARRAASIDPMEALRIE